MTSQEEDNGLIIRTIPSEQAIKEWNAFKISHIKQAKNARNDFLRSIAKYETMEQNIANNSLPKTFLPISISGLQFPAILGDQMIQQFKEHLNEQINDFRKRSYQETMKLYHKTTELLQEKTCELASLEYLMARINEKSFRVSEDQIIAILDEIRNESNNESMLIDITPSQQQQQQSQEEQQQREQAQQETNRKRRSINDDNDILNNNPNDTTPMDQQPQLDPTSNFVMLFDRMNVAISNQTKLITQIQAQQFHFIQAQQQSQQQNQQRSQSNQRLQQQPRTYYRPQQYQRNSSPYRRDPFQPQRNLSRHNSPYDRTNIQRRNHYQPQQTYDHHNQRAKNAFGGASRAPLHTR